MTQEDSPPTQSSENQSGGSRSLIPRDNIVVSSLRYIGAYVHAVFRGWVALLGGIGGIVLGIFLKDDNKAFLWAAIVCLIIAGFLVWLKERQSLERLDGSALLSSTPKKLVSVFKDKTRAQVESRAKTHEGKWIELSGSILDVYETKSMRNRGQAIIVVLDGKPEVIFRFSRQWVDRVREYSPGDQITVLGQIQKIEREKLSLRRCEVRDVVLRESLE